MTYDGSRACSMCGGPSPWVEKCDGCEQNERGYNEGAAHEREACAAIAEAEATRPKKIPHSHPEAQAYAAACERIAAEIRGRAR